MKPIPGVEKYFDWPANWNLPSCGGCGTLRAPVNLSAEKSPSRIRKVLVGLNPGKDEMEQGCYFVGQAGKWLRSEKYRTLWTWLGAPGEVLVTNIVKLGSSNAKDMERHGEAALSQCAKSCFCAEVSALPRLEAIILLGDAAAGLFARVCVPELQARRPAGNRIALYEVRHPSFCWTARGFEQGLQASLEKPKGFL